MTFSRTLLLAAAVVAAPCAHAAPFTKILWDQYAVPHIYGPDIPTVVRGLGYASMENHAELLLRKIARARGRLAEYFGATAPGNSEDYVASDTAIIQYGLRTVAADWVKRGGPDQLLLLQAYCDGVNEYYARHPADIEPELRPILPMVPTDVMAIGAYVAYYDFEDGQDFVQALAAYWQLGGRAGGFHPPAKSRQAGSNAILIGPQKSADGHAILVANSHLPWGVNQPVNGSDSYFGAVQFMEANLIVGNPARPRLNAAGVAWPGLPFFAEGFNDFAGWTHTSNNIYNADLFQLALDGTGQNYLYGGTYRPLQHGTDTLKVRLPDHTYRTIMVDTYASVHGPVIVFNKARTQALAVRMAGIRQPATVKQYWNMLQARNLVEFRQAEQALQLPVFNVFFADRAGEIYYLFGGRTPVRGCPYSLTYLDGVLVPPIQDGTNPACLWTKTLPLQQLPQAANPPGGYFANGNEAPWYASFPQPAGLNPANYPASLTADGVDFRPRSLHTWLNQSSGLTPSAVLAGKNSTYLTLADAVLADLITIANQAAAKGDTKAAQAAAILAAWDRTANETSVGGVLFEAWWDNVANDVLAGKISADVSLAYSSNPHAKFTTAFDPANPLTTPAGLDPSNNAQLLADLDQAFDTLQANFAAEGGAAVAWGATHKTTLVSRRGAQQQTVELPFLVNDPESGADDEFGGIRVVNPAYAPPLGEFVSYGGESYVHVVEFTPTGAVGGSVMTYGNASRPNSPHIADQAALFRAEQLKPELRSFAAVRAAAVGTESY